MTIKSYEGIFTTRSIFGKIAIKNIFIFLYILYKIRFSNDDNFLLAIYNNKRFSDSDTMYSLKYFYTNRYLIEFSLIFHFEKKKKIFIFLYDLYKIRFSTDDNFLLAIFINKLFSDSDT